MKLLSARIAAFACVLALGVFPGTAPADDTTPGLIVARTRPVLVLLWNTNAAVTAAPADEHGDALVRDIVAQAAQIVADHAKTAPSEAKTIELDLLYARPGGMDPRYNVDTLASIARVGHLVARLPDALADGAAWPAAIRDGRTPKGLHVTLDDAKLAPLRTP